MKALLPIMLSCFMSSLLMAGDEPTSVKGTGPGGWLGFQVHSEYYGLSLGIPIVTRGGRSLGLHLGYGGTGASQEWNPYPDGLVSKTGMNLGLCMGGKVFWAAGVERMKRTDAHRAFVDHQTSSYETTEERTSGYLLLGYRSWPGFGIYVQGGGAIGIGFGISVQL
jgi:hypothetical protein